MSLYSIRLFAGQLEAEVNPAYTVPDGFVAVIRDIVVYNETGDTDTFNAVAIVPGPLSLIAWSFADQTVYTSAQWQGRQVLNAGDVLYFYAGHYPWHVLASGYLLSSP